MAAPTPRVSTTSCSSSSSSSDDAQGETMNPTATPPPGTTPVDPVCAMTIAPEDAVATVDHRGHAYYFCTAECARRFREHPEAFLAPSRHETSVAAPSASDGYTSPMHPEIVRDEPGFCPICGMALEPRTVVAEA